RGGTGRRTGLKIRCSERDVTVRFGPGPPFFAEIFFHRPPNVGMPRGHKCVGLGGKGSEEVHETAEMAPQIIPAYLSNAHFDDVENACPMVALPSDVARASDNAKRAYRAAFEGMVAILEQGADRPSR